MSRKGAGEMLVAVVEVLPVLLLSIWQHAVLFHLIQVFPFIASTSSEDCFSSECSGEVTHQQHGAKPSPDFWPVTTPLQEADSISWTQRDRPCQAVPLQGDKERVGVKGGERTGRMGFFSTTRNPRVGAGTFGVVPLHSLCRPSFQISILL